MPEVTVAALHREARDRLAAAGGASAALDARLLLSDSLGLTQAELHLRANDRVQHDKLALFQSRLERRLAGEPVFRILGSRPFWDHVFQLSPDTLEPRPDTEALVGLAVDALAARFSRGRPFRFADVGTGTGAIAVSVLAAFPLARCVAVDIAAGALETAACNARAAGVATRFEPILSNYLDAVPGPLDAILSNPPYIPTADLDRLDREVREHDPRRALDGGVDGLDAYRAIAVQAPSRLSADGDLFLEIGADQAADVTALMEGAGLRRAGTRHDLAGHERALWFRRHGERKSV